MGRSKLSIPKYCDIPHTLIYNNNIDFCLVQYVDDDQV